MTDSSKKITCYKCKEDGHYRNQCPLLKNNNNKCVFNVVFLNGKFNKTEWYVDSGASAHMTANESWIKDMNATPCLTEIVVADESKVPVVCSGDVDIVSDLNFNITVKDVLCVPSLTTNLLSVSELIKNGNSVSFDEKHCYIRNKSNILVATADLSDGVYKLRLHTRSCMLAAPKVSGKIWHRRLAHINSQDMNKMRNMVDGLSYKNNNDITKSQCTTCCERKQERLPFSHVGDRSTETLQRIHTDLCGPMVHVPKERRLKRDKKSEEHILLGYGENVKGYRLYNPVKRTLVTSRDVIFMEEELGTEEKSQDSAIWIPNEETPAVGIHEEVNSDSVGEVLQNVLDTEDYHLNSSVMKLQLDLTQCRKPR
ncbi:hypothetical protein HF086_002096 [Spodoptera exigua]|uniref:CCHC-type domain-containing protein n=1 Tax=Spodoptera exigua TaxID=7107 RepID=A0A922SI96_SPOEX|nr:hypothetical protein HF086_002096 [Spodoptera exigua]